MIGERDKMDIQEITIEQIEDVKRLMLAVFSGEPWNDAWTEDQLHAYLTQLMGEHHSLSFGIYLHGSLSGVSLGKIKSWCEGTEYWIEEFGVLPQMQRKGVGSQFIQEMEKALIKRGITHIVLLTERDVPAYGFYQKNGFEEKKEYAFFAKTLS